MRDVETPLHPRARKGRLIGDAYISVNLDLTQMCDSFRLISERVLVFQYQMTMLQKPLSLITLTGV
jgi:hypothetical protein